MACATIDLVSPWLSINRYIVSKKPSVNQLKEMFYQPFVDKLPADGIKKLGSNR
jgi:hypothetical protein